MTFFTSCKTVEVVRVEYYIPEIDFPEFPKLGECKKVDGMILTDEEYFRKLLIFREEYRNAIEKYNAKKNKLEEMKNEL